MASEGYGIKIRNAAARLALDEEILARVRAGGAPDVRGRTIAELERAIVSQRRVLEILRSYA